MTLETHKAVAKFLADAKLPWQVFFMVCMDGLALPANTDVAVLNAAAHRIGVAGFVGYLHKASTNELEQMIRPWGTETPEVTAVLNAAAKGLSLDSEFVDGDAPPTGPVN
jgi:hypothetical protein